MGNSTMKTSEYGINKIKGYEGYKRKLPDGGCAAYQIKYRGKLDIPTIGWGCTEGVTMGMVWTLAQAEEGLRKEIAKFEAAVTRLVTVDINQNEFDALVALSYNIGIAGFSRSTVLKRLNKGDRVGAAKAFALWNKVGAFVEKGLVSRRASEAALFLKPVEEPVEPYMPQTVAESVSPPSAATVATGAACTGVAAAPLLPIPSLPAAPDLGFITNWWSSGETLHIVGQSASQKPLLVIGILAWIAAMILLPKIAERFGWSRS